MAWQQRAVMIFHDVLSVINFTFPGPWEISHSIFPPHISPVHPVVSECGETSARQMSFVEWRGVTGEKRGGAERRTKTYRFREESVACKCHNVACLRVLINRIHISLAFPAPFPSLLPPLSTCPLPLPLPQGERTGNI